MAERVFGAERYQYLMKAKPLSQLPTLSLMNYSTLRLDKGFFLHLQMLALGIH